MGLLLSRFSQVLFGSKPTKILLLGLDAAGKTTILYKLKLKENVLAIPTIGFNNETIRPINNVTFTLWDIGGGEKIRPLLKHYYGGVDGLLFVVDSADVKRISEVREELFRILKDEGMALGCPVVVLANKQDLPNALNAKELIERLGMHELKGNPWHVQEVCVFTGDGLYEGVGELASMVKKIQNERKQIIS